MKKLIMKLLGLDSFLMAVNLSVELLRKENEELKKSLAELEEKLDGLEEFDSSQYVSEDDINDRVESFLNDNDYVTQSYCDDEIQSKVDEAIEDADIDSKIESAIEDLDIEEKVRDLFNDASPAPMSEDDIRKEVAEAVKVTLEKMVKALADQQK
jgi:hypothetical protein